MPRYEVPLINQSQSLTVAMAGITYQLTIRWNVAASAWILDIADKDAIPILSGVPIVTGTDLLAQYSYLNFGGTLTASTDGNLNADEVPTYDNLGIASHLYFTTP